MKPEQAIAHFISMTSKNRSSRVAEFNDASEIPDQQVAYKQIVRTVGKLIGGS